MSPAQQKSKGSPLPHRREFSKFSLKPETIKINSKDPYQETPNAVLGGFGEKVIFKPEPKETIQPQTSVVFHNPARVHTPTRRQTHLSPHM